MSKCAQTTELTARSQWWNLVQIQLIRPHAQRTGTTRRFRHGEIQGPRNASCCGAYKAIGRKHHPRIGRDWFCLNEQIGIDFAGEPLLRLVKCVAHDVSENLMCEKTLALALSKASEICESIIHVMVVETVRFGDLIRRCLSMRERPPIWRPSVIV